MKILFLCDFFPPEVNAPASRAIEHLRRWVKNGADVTVVTCFPNFPQGRIYPGYKNGLRKVEMIEGIRVVRVWSYIAPNEGFVKRTLDQLSAAVTIFTAALFERADVIFATSPNFFTTAGGGVLSVLKRKPWIFELRDIWPESLVAVGVARKSRMIAFLEKIEMAMYRSATRVVALTPAFKTQLIRRGISAGKIDVITNGADLTLWKPRPKDHDWLERHNLQGKFILAYVGTHGLAHGLDFIVQTAALVPDPRIHFLFVGDGGAKSEAVSLARELNLKNVTFLDSVPKAQVPAIIASSDVALVPLRRSDTFKTVIPSKIFESAAMRRPILLGVEGQAAEIVESHRAGICFEPESTASLLDAIKRISGSNEDYAQYQHGCERLADSFDRDRLASDLLGIIEQVHSDAKKGDS